MIQNNNFSVLPWYTDIDEQNHRKSYAYGAIFPLITPMRKLLPFQIIRKHGVKSISELIPYNGLTSLQSNVPPSQWYYENHAVMNGKFVSKVKINISVAGVFTIVVGKNINSSNYTFTKKVFNVVVGVNELPINTQLGNDEALGFGDYTDTAKFYFGALNTENTVGGYFMGRSQNGTWSTPLTKHNLSIGVFIESENAEISFAKLYNKDGVFVNDITTQLKETGLQIAPFPQLGYDVIIYPGIFSMDISTPEGIYYVELSDGNQIWYSEMFTIVSNTNNYLKIEWFDIENLVFDAGLVVYQNPQFKNVLYLCTELGKPEYPFEEEGETRDGYFFVEKQISEKTYRCICLAPEYLCDVMRFIRMADYVNITDKYGRKYSCDTFLITPKWQIQGDLASVEIEFQTATVVKKIGRGIISTNKGDFNKDFNNDFNK